MTPVDLTFFFNFRSPYCYLASKTAWDVFDDFHINLLWRPLGGWARRSDPDRARVKVPLVRQDVARWARKLGIPMSPPPISTEPTRAGAASLLAEVDGRLREYAIETMRIEWGEGRDIGELDVLREVARRIGMDEQAVIEAADDPVRRSKLEANAQEAQQKGVFGVPTFIVGDEVFWGNDRLDFLRDHLRELRLSTL